MKMICRKICLWVWTSHGIKNVLKTMTLYDKFIEIQIQNNLFFQVKGNYIYAMYSKYKLKHKIGPNYVKWVRICLKILNKTQ